MRLAALAFAVLASASAQAEESWCPVPGGAYAAQLIINDDGYRFGRMDCRWANEERTASICGEAQHRVFIEDDAEALWFDHYDVRFGVSAGPQPFTRCD